MNNYQRMLRDSGNKLIDAFGEKSSCEAVIENSDMPVTVSREYELPNKSIAFDSFTVKHGEETISKHLKISEVIEKLIEFSCSLQSN